MTDPTAIEYRAATTLGVNVKQRIVELVVMPYEQEAVVGYQGRTITEVCSRGAYDGIERRANRVRVNRDHDPSRLVGKAITFHPSRDIGLVAEVRMSKTVLGDETLELAEDGVLDASAGFGVMDGGETWENRDRRRLTKCFLHHIGMTPDPAYEGANVLAVRHADLTPAGSGTPFLDRVLAERLAVQYGLDQ